jgi:hypothetical protein
MSINKQLNITSTFDCLYRATIHWSHNVPSHIIILLIARHWLWRSLFHVHLETEFMQLLHTGGIMQAKTRKHLLTNEQAKRSKLTTKINSFEEQIQMESIIKFQKVEKEAILLTAL